MNLPQLKQFKTIKTNNKYGEKMTIKIFSTYYKMNHDTKRCFLAYDGSWQYEQDMPSNVYGQSLLELKRFLKDEGTIEYKFK
jgi:hypothetical protein